MQAGLVLGCWRDQAVFGEAWLLSYGFACLVVLHGQICCSMEMGPEEAALGCCSPPYFGLQQ